MIEVFTRRSHDVYKCLKGQADYAINCLKKPATMGLPINDTIRRVVKEIFVSLALAVVALPFLYSQPAAFVICFLTGFACHRKVKSLSKDVVDMFVQKRILLIHFLQWGGSVFFFLLGFPYSWIATTALVAACLGARLNPNYKNPPRPEETTIATVAVEGPREIPQIQSSIELRQFLENQNRLLVSQAQIIENQKEEISILKQLVNALDEKNKKLPEGGLR